MHPRIKERIDKLIRSKEAEIDADLMAALDDVAEIFISFPILGKEAQEFSLQLKKISEAIECSDAATDYGASIRFAVIELLRQVNPRLEIVGGQLKELSEYFSEFHIELKNTLLE